MVVGVGPTRRPRVTKVQFLELLPFLPPAIFLIAALTLLTPPQIHDFHNALSSCKDGTIANGLGRIFCLRVDLLCCLNDCS